MNTNEALNFQAQFQERGDLLWFEGPILSHFVNARKEDFLLFWAGQSGEINRWLLFEVSRKNLRAFFEKQATLRNLALSVPKGFLNIVDINGQAIWTRHEKVAAAGLSPNLLPGEKSFFDERSSEPYALQLMEEVKSPPPVAKPAFEFAPASRPALQKTELWAAGLVANLSHKNHGEL